jgi:hypothetical protein
MLRYCPPARNYSVKTLALLRHPFCDGDVHVQLQNVRGATTLCLGCWLGVWAEVQQQVLLASWLPCTACSAGCSLSAKTHASKLQSVFSTVIGKCPTVSYGSPPSFKYD